MRRKFRVTSGGLGRHDAHVGGAALFSKFRADRAGRRALNVDAIAVEISNPALNSLRSAFALIAEISQHVDELGCRDRTPPLRGSSCSAQQAKARVGPPFCWYMHWRR
jgi:hypothetical protein